MTWRLTVTPKVQEALRTFPPQVKRYIRQGLREIREDPRVGKPLKDELTGFHSFRTHRFRIVYQIRRDTITVFVIGIGPRETVYQEVAGEIR